jgi:hypothetical protein
MQPRGRTGGGDHRLRAAQCPAPVAAPEQLSAPEHRPRATDGTVTDDSTRSSASAHAGGGARSVRSRGPSTLAGWSRSVSRRRETVAGWTMPSACCQPAHSRQRTLHSPRSQRLRCGRRFPTVRLRTPTWWRRARFSKASSRCVFKSDRAASRRHHSRLSMAKEVTARRRMLQGFRYGPVSGRDRRWSQGQTKLRY